jgi:starch phosphorylase
MPPLEACGTSGKTASLNAVPHLSILNGCWIEAFNGQNGWSIGC